MSSFSPFDAIGQRFEMRLGSMVFSCMIKQAMFSIQPQFLTVIDDLGDPIEDIPTYTEWGMNIDIVMWPVGKIPEELEDGGHELEVHRRAGDIGHPRGQLQLGGGAELVAPAEEEA